MAIAEQKVRKIINVRKDGTEYSAQEWAEHWKEHTVPLTDETLGFYRTIAGMIKKEKDLNRAPEKHAVEVATN